MALSDFFGLSQQIGQGSSNEQLIQQFLGMQQPFGGVPLPNVVPQQIGQGNTNNQLMQQFLSSGSNPFQSGGAGAVADSPLGFLGQLDQFLDSNAGQTLLDFGQGALGAALGGQGKGLPQSVGSSNFPIPQGFSPQQALLQVLGLT